MWALGNALFHVWIICLYTINWKFKTVPQVNLMWGSSYVNHQNMASLVLIQGMRRLIISLFMTSLISLSYLIFLGNWTLFPCFWNMKRLNFYRTGMYLAPLLVVVHSWILWMILKITTMLGTLHLVLCAQESTQLHDCWAYMSPKHMILFFRQKLHVGLLW